MKKNYITPNTEMTTFASMGLMEDVNIAFGMETVSGGTQIRSTSDVNLID